MIRAMGTMGAGILARRSNWWGVAVGFAADRLLGDPTHHHPVAGFGTWSAACERLTYADRHDAGVGHLVVATAPWVGAAWYAERRASRMGRAVVLAAVTWAALGGRSLEREAMAVHAHLAAGDVVAARQRIRSLVGRDTSELDADELARAVVESLAENQSDAVAATLLWGLVAGAPGVVLHRCVNTLDAMVGHRTDRYERFGWAAARCDDALNWAPARVSVLATAAVVALEVRSLNRAGHILRTALTDGRAHPSPNAGPVEAAAAAALRVRLGGTNIYAGAVEDRGVLGADGRPVTADDIPRAVRLTRRIALTVLTAGILAARP